MPLYELEWSMQGKAVIEADDPDEADELLQAGLENLDSSQFEEVDVHDVTADSCELRKVDD